jgi:UrcA family protein
MTTTRHLQFAAALATTTLLASTASATERQRTVQYSDLDLSTAAGQATLKKRVNSAVNNVCGFPSVETAADRLDRSRCEARARTSAMRKVAQTIARYGGDVKVAID